MEESSALGSWLLALGSSTFINIQRPSIIILLFLSMVIPKMKHWRWFYGLHLAVDQMVNTSNWLFLISLKLTYFPGIYTGLRVYKLWHVQVRYSAWRCGLLLVFFTILFCSTLTTSSRIIISTSICTPKQNKTIYSSWWTNFLNLIIDSEHPTTDSFPADMPVCIQNHKTSVFFLMPSARV